MAMTMNGEVELPASREVVWAKLNDPEILKACIPGCEELEKTDEQNFRAVAKMKVGPVSARFRGKVTLSDLDPPNGYKISGEGEGESRALPRAAQPWDSPRRTAVRCFPTTSKRRSAASSLSLVSA
jgi:carbon monoxide dehydrogenase subunit G